MITMNDIYTYSIASKKPMLGDLTKFDFMKDYNENSDLFDNIMNYDYGSMIYRTTFTTVKEASEMLQILVKAFFTKYSYKYIGLYNSTQLEYNPIENYSVTETESDVRTPNVSRETTNSFGNRKTADTNINQTSTIDSEAWVNREKTTTETSEDSYVNTSKEVESGTDTTKHDLKRSGNIGVTTSQQMLESERKIVNYSFMEQVINDIVTNFFYYDETEVNFYEG